MRFTFIILLLMFNLQAKSLFTNDNQAATSAYIQNLKTLILATQKTRGLTNAYLHGNTAAMLLVYKNRNDMKTAIGNMEATSLASDPVINSRATAISQALIKLNHKAFKQNPDAVFAAYTEQIAQTLMLAQTVNKRFSENLTPFGKEASTVMMEIMLPMTEYTGQLRGFGAGLAAKGTVSKSELEKIMVLSYQLGELNNKLQQQSGKIFTVANRELAAVNKAVTAYTLYAQKNFANNPEKIDSSDYFDKGTKVISLISKAYDKINKAVLEDSKGWF